MGQLRLIVFTTLLKTVSRTLVRRIKILEVLSPLSHYHFMKTSTDLLATLDEVLGKDSSVEDRIKKSLNVIFEAFDAKNCTLHRADLGDSFLHLVSQIGLPEHIALWLERFQ